MGERRISRQIALQVLYSMDISQDDPRRSLQLYLSGADDLKSPEAISFAREIVEGVASNREKIDDIISKNSSNWKISRMAAVDRNILRVAVFEFFFCKDIPKKVTLNEAIEIAKAFGTEESGSFVNGLLDKISKEVKDKE